MVTGLGTASGGIVLALAAPAGSAAAATPPYELYCPGTPVGNVVLNGAVTSGTITPASPAAGATFNLDDYQTVVNVPEALASASAALGNSALSGSATATVNATGATPASIASPTITFSSPLSSPIPAAGITLNLPDPASTMGPFTASGGAITMAENSAAKLTLNVSGSSISLTCTAYPNNSAATGIVTSPPTGSPISPVIATTTAAGGSTTPTTAAAATGTTTPTTAATAPPTGAATGTTTPAATPAATAMTGAGPHLWLLAAAGGALLCLGFASLAFGEGPRSLLRRLRPGGVDDRSTGAGDGLWMEGSSPGGSHELWITGGEPDGDA
jgi:hypothetical protein